MPTILSSLLGGPYAAVIKYGTISVVVLGLCGFSYYKGVSHEKVVVQDKIVTQIVTQYKALPAEEAKETAAVTVVKTVHDKEIQYVEKDVPVAPACDLSADAVGVLNSLRGTLSPESK